MIQSATCLGFLFFLACAHMHTNTHSDMCEILNPDSEKSTHLQSTDFHHVLQAAGRRWILNQTNCLISLLAATSNKQYMLPLREISVKTTDLNSCTMHERMQANHAVFRMENRGISSSDVSLCSARGFLRGISNIHKHPSMPERVRQATVTQNRSYTHAHTHSFKQSIHIQLASFFAPGAFFNHSFSIVFRWGLLWYDLSMVCLSRSLFVCVWLRYYYLCCEDLQYILNVWA